MPEYTNTEMYNLIDEWIHNARDRRIMKDRLINGIPIDGRDGLSYKYDISVSQLKRIVEKYQDMLMMKLKIGL